ncbi:MAG: type II secretion system protein GspM [Polymorphobacter sp.]
MTGLSLRERRLVAVALLIAALAVLLYVVILPIIDGFMARADERAALLETYERDARAVAQIVSTRRVAEAQQRDAGRFRLAGANAVAAADALKERIAAAVTATGGDLRAIEDSAGNSGTIQVRADARLTNGQLTGLLVGLQRGEPLLVIETLSVTATEAGQTGRSGPMDIRFEVSGSYPAPR